MKGGIASKNLVLQVGDYHSTAKSTISGIVRSGKGEIQGARVVIEPAPIVEHTVSLAGSLGGSYLPNANNEPLHYLIDGEKSPDLVFRRGEIHRFTFDSSTDGFPLSLFRHPEHEMPKVRLNMLVTPKVDQPGENYIVPPTVNLSGGSSFSNYLTHEMGTILDYQNGLIGNASKPLVVTRPYAKSLLFDTNVTNVRTRPVEKDSDGLSSALAVAVTTAQTHPMATLTERAFGRTTMKPTPRSRFTWMESVRFPRSIRKAFWEASGKPEPAPTPLTRLLKCWYGEREAMRMPPSSDT